MFQEFWTRGDGSYEAETQETGPGGHQGHPPDDWRTDGGPETRLHHPI